MDFEKYEDRGAVSHDLGLKFLGILDKKAKFPERNDWAEHKIARYISSGIRGHSITIHRVLDDARQLEILRMLWRALSKSP